MRFSAQAENGLCLHVAAFGDGARRRVALGDENTTLFAQVAFGVVVVNVAVAQFLVVQTDFFGALACQFRYAGNGFALFLRIDYLFEQGFGHHRVFVQIVVHLFAHKVAHKFVDAYARPLIRIAFAVFVGCHVGRTEFYLGLTFECRLYHVDGDGGHYAAANVGQLEIFVVILLDGACQMFAQRTLVRAALCGVLAVDKRVVFLAVLVAVSERYLDVVAFQVHDWVERVRCAAVLQQVEQTVARHKLLPVEHKCQTGVQVGVVAQHLFDILGAESVFAENLLVGRKHD